jgi:NAD(P)H-nitrite reductase large subunit
VAKKSRVPVMKFTSGQQVILAGIRHEDIKTFFLKERITGIDPGEDPSLDTPQYKEIIDRQLVIDNYW